MSTPSAVTPPTHDYRTARVSTWLTDQETAVLSHIPSLSPQFIHRCSLDMVHDDLRSGTSGAALISAARAHQKHRAHLTALVTDFPHHPIVGVTTPIHTSAAMQGAFLLGQSGVRDLVDVTRVGWHGLGKVIGTTGACDPIWNDPFWVHAKMTLRAAVPEPPSEYDRFLTALFDPRTVTVCALAKLFGLSTNGLTGRFNRAGLPTPKRYLIEARLVSTAWLAETRVRTCGDIARRLRASSTQALCRTIQRYAECSFSTFREHNTGASRLASVCDELIVPYRGTWQHFDRILRPVWKRSDVQ